MGLPLEAGQACARHTGQIQTLEEVMWPRELQGWRKAPQPTVSSGSSNGKYTKSVVAPGSFQFSSLAGIHFSHFKEKTNKGEILYFTHGTLNHLD